MKKFSLSVLLLAFLTFNLAAQNSFDYSKPLKVDEFGLLQVSDVKARLDAVAMVLQNSANSRIVIVGYRSKDEPIGKTLRNFRMMRFYLSQHRGIDSERLKMIDGGETSFGFGFQIWIMPQGQVPELLERESDYLENKGVARKFDESYYAFNDLEYDYWDGDSFKEFSDLLKKEPNSIAYVILYPEYSKYGDENGKPVIRKDSLRKISRVKAGIRKDLTKVRIPSSKIKVVNGGYRDYRQIELWILPKGIAPPVPTPNQFP